MGSISLQIPQVGQPDSSEDPKIASDLTTIQAVINGNLDSSNLVSSVLPTRANVGIARGQSFVTFSASQTSATKTVAHGLSGIPTAVVCMASGWFGVVVEQAGIPPDASNFSVVGWNLGGAISGSLNFFWIAVL